MCVRPRVRDPKHHEVGVESHRQRDENREKDPQPRILSAKNLIRPDLEIQRYERQGDIVKRCHNFNSQSCFFS